MSYYLAVNGKKYGPFELDQIIANAKSLKTETPILYWKDGMDEWKSITELSVIKAPPLPFENNVNLKPDEKGFIVHSSTKSLLSKYSPIMVLESIMLFIAIFSILLFKSYLLLVFSILLLLFIIFVLVIDYIIISNTKYFIYPDHLKSESYLFRLLGVHSKTINLKLLKHIEAYSNNYLDVLFFNCGKIVITVSGDIEDLEMRNIEKPMMIKNRIENMLFGKSEITEGNPSMRASSKNR